MALFFLREIRGKGPTAPDSPLAVVLLTNDNAQATLARSHGLPACSTRELDALGGLFDAAKRADGTAGTSMTASVVRAAIAQVATAGTCRQA